MRFRGGLLDRAGGLRADGKVTQPADLVRMYPVRGDRRQHLLKRGGERFALARIERGRRVVKDLAAAVEHARRRFAALLGEHDGDRTPVVAWSPFRVTVGGELVDEPDGGGLRAAERQPELLDRKTRLLREYRE